MNALFFDLDGTLIIPKSGDRFPRDINDWEPVSGIIRAIKNVQAEFDAFFIVTNQGGIQKGYVTTSELNAKILRVVKHFKDNGVLIKEFFVCPFLDATAECRKPNTGMFDKAKLVYPSLQPDKCLMVGDASGKEADFSDSDLMFAQNAGMEYMDVLDFLLAFQR